ncbi:MAG: hypothetical protein EA361_11925 [Bacteroidetes bacterium]|nr:MAG: hypothetical protein EA361_11925 [Bacteroidota bacterium]
MTHSDVHKKIQSIIRTKMKVRHHASSYTANFTDDYFMSPWEVNLLLYFVEDQFNIQLDTKPDKQLFSMNQLVSIVYRHKSESAPKTGSFHHSFIYPKIQIYEPSYDNNF